MSKLQGFLTSVLAFLSGMVLSSLYFTGGDNWKLYLPLCLLITALKFTLAEYLNECN